MKYFLTVCASIFFVFCTVFAQDNSFIKHTVLKGETVIQIASKYKVTPFDIYRLNPDSQSGIKVNEVILIPDASHITNGNSGVFSKGKNISEDSQTYVVKAGESFYSIAKDFQITFEELKNANPKELKEGLKIGQAIIIPHGNAEKKDSDASPSVAINQKNKSLNAKSDEKVYHVVMASETKFGIAKKYGITVEDLEKNNPDIGANLSVGHKLIISGSTAKKEIAKQSNEESKLAQQLPVPHPQRIAFANYEVKAKETLYSLSQKFQITLEELIALNPSLKDGLKVDMILKVPGRGSFTVEPESSAKFADLTKTINKMTKKELVLLLPFNASKIQGDTLNTIASRLKKDAFLNMTLDFYSGALMAIDSAKTLGMNINVKIFDSEETKSSSNVVNLVTNNLQSADAIIGPFYQQNVEKVAELLKNKNIPVISPLSKEIGKPCLNLFQSMTPSEESKSAILNFMTAKNANIILVSDPKKLSNREFITRKYHQAKIVALNENGSLNPDNLKALFVKDKMNYVILDSEKTGMILATTNLLLSELANFQIQLAILEPNETLDFEEIAMKRLTVLKMLYPSLTRENNSPEAIAFENEYKKINKIFPSQFAIRGFDVTFDTLLRLSQGKSFEACANEDNTEQIESKFEYVKKEAGGYTNKGVYILQFEEDLSVKQVN